jgi:hypothetical protein
MFVPSVLDGDEKGLARRTVCEADIELEQFVPGCAEHPEEGRRQQSGHRECGENEPKSMTESKNTRFRNAFAPRGVVQQFLEEMPNHGGASAGSSSP